MADDPQEGINLPLLKATGIGVVFSINGKVYGDATTSLTDKGGFRSTAAKLRFFFAEPQFRSKMRLDIKAVRKQDLVDRSINPTGALYHETQIEFPANSIKTLHDAPLAEKSKLPPQFNMPNFRTEASSPLRIIEFECEGFTITRPDVPALQQPELENSLRELVLDLTNLPQDRRKVSVMILVRLFPGTLDAILAEMRLAIKRDKASDPVMNWIKNSGEKKLLLPGNIHSLDTRPTTVYAHWARDRFFDSLEYKVTLGYNRVRQFEWEAGQTSEYVNDTFDIKIVDIASACGVVGPHDTKASKIYLGLVNYANHSQTRPTEGQSFKVRLPMKVPPCEPYTGDNLSLKQIKAKADREAKEALLKSQQEHWERENEGKDVVTTPYPDAIDEDAKAAQDAEKDDEDLHWWSGYVVRSDAFTPKGFVPVMLHRPRDFRYDGAKADRPHVKTEVMAMSADFHTEDSFIAGVNVHAAVSGKLLPHYSDRVLKDELRSIETLISGWHLETQEPPSALQQHLGQFLWSVDQSLQYPEVDFTEQFGGTVAIQRFCTKVGISAYQLSIIMMLLKYKHGLVLLNGCFGSGKTEYGIIFGALLLASNSKLFHASIANSEADSAVATAQNLIGDSGQEKLLWTTTTNIATDSAAERFAHMLESAGVSATVIRCHNLDGEKSHLVDHYVPHPRFEPIPASDQQAYEFLARSMLHGKAVKHLAVRAKGDPRRRVVNLKLSDAMIRELDSNRDNQDYKQLRLFMESMVADPEDTDVDRVEFKRLVGVLERNTLRKADAVFCTNAAAIRPAMTINFKPTFGVNDETARAAEISTAAVFGSYPSVRSWLLIYDPVQMHPYQGHVSEGKKFDDPFHRQGNLSLPQRLESAGLQPVVIMKQYRCHGLLSKFSSDHYYHGMVEDGNADQNPDKLKFVRGFFKREFGVNDNVVFIDANGARSQREELGTSSCNNDYIDKIYEILKSLLAALDRDGSPWTKTFSIGITSHYAAQVQLYREMIEDIGDDRVCAMPSDAVQGENKDLMFRDWCQSKVITSHNGDVHRTLVTGTRARYGQIDIGASSTWDASNYKRLNNKGLEYDSATKHAYAFYQFCQSHDAIFVSEVEKQNLVGPNTLCYNCGEKGHAKDTCVNAKVWKCGICEKFGHKDKFCPTKPCTRCFSTDHVLSDCTQEPQYCRRCNTDAHKPSECSRPRKCNRCKKMGHISDDCTGEFVHECRLCGQNHETHKCNVQQAPTRQEMASKEAWDAKLGAMGATIASDANAAKSTQGMSVEKLNETLQAIEDYNDGDDDAGVAAVSEGWSSSVPAVEPSQTADGGDWETTIASEADNRGTTSQDGEFGDSSSAQIPTGEVSLDANDGSGNGGPSVEDPGTNTNSPNEAGPTEVDAFGEKVPVPIAGDVGTGVESGGHEDAPKGKSAGFAQPRAAGSSQSAW